MQFKWAGRVLAALVMVGLLSGTVMAQEDVFSQVPTDSTVVIVFRDGVEFNKKFERLAMQIVPMQPGNPQMQIVTTMLGGMANLDATKLKADAPVVLVMKLAADVTDEPHGLLLVQPADMNGFLADLEQVDGMYDRGSWQMSRVIKSGAFAVLGDEDDLTAYKASKLGLTLNAQQQKLWDGADIMVLANLKQVFEATAPLYQQQVAGLEAQLKALEEAGEAGAEMRPKLQMALTMMKAGWALGQELQWSALVARVDARAVSIEGITGYKEGGALETYLAGHPAIGEKLIPNLPDVANWMAGWYSYNPETVNKGTTELLAAVEKLLPMAPPEMKAPLEKGFAGLQKHVLAMAGQMGGRGAMAMLADPEGEGGGLMRMVSVQQVKDSAAYRQQLQTFMNWYQQTITEFMQLAGPEVAEQIELKATYSENAANIGGLSIDKFESKVAMKQGPQEAQQMMAMMMKSMYGGENVVQWLAFKDGYAYTELGQQPKFMPQLLAAEQGGGMAAAMAEARKQAVPDANLLVIVSISGYMDTLSAMAMSMQGVEMPAGPLAPVSARSVFSMAGKKGQLHGKMYIPVQEMQMAVASGMRMAMSMQALSGMFEGAQPPMQQEEEPAEF